MEILVLGGTRFFGIHLVRELIKNGHTVTIATRGKTKDEFGNRVKRITIERTNMESLKNAFKSKFYDIVYDNLAYCSNDVKNILNAVECDRYIMVSSTAVYDKHIDTKEEEFDASKFDFKWCSRNDFSYSESKRQAECALKQKYIDQKSVAVRYPFVIGVDDYTKRLLFYIEHILKEKPMYVDNLENKLGFIRSDEAGEFLAFLADKNFCGAINGSNYGTISIKDVVEYVEDKTGNKALFSEKGDPAPYNGENEYSINTDKAKDIGFQFSSINDWIFNLIDTLIEQISFS